MAKDIDNILCTSMPQRVLPDPRAVTALSKALAAAVAQVLEVPPQLGSPRKYAVRKKPQSCHDGSLSDTNHSTG
jgi:hypothetical protein